MKDLLTQETIEKIKGEGVPVIIFGAGIVGEALLAVCQRYGVEVECFCDNSIDKAGSLLSGKKILHTDSLDEKYKDARFLISAADIKDVVNQLTGLGYKSWYPATALLRDFDASHYELSSGYDFVEFAVSTCLLCHDSYMDDEKLFMRSVDIVITEKCSLKCRDCSNLMQFYEDAKDCDLDEVMNSIDALCNIIDQVNEFRIIGGEPFMNKDMHLVIKRLVDEPKVRKIVIYTNGTILPREREMEYLKSEKVMLIITDYGEKSRKLKELLSVLKENSTAYHILNIEGWSDCSTITKRDRSVEEQKKTFRDCCAKNLITLLGGKFYRCPFAANADRLGAIPDDSSNYIDILALDALDKDVIEKKKEVKGYLQERDYLEACDYCAGRPLDVTANIPPAIQAKEPLDYIKVGR